MKQQRMYDEFAHLWPLIGPPEDYAAEASYWREALRAMLGPGRHEVLELGVGGGSNLSHLTGDFQATAVDISEKMLANSIKLNPDVDHHVGDMRSFRLRRKFKAVLIGDAIAYLTTEADLRSTFATAVAHLDSGGVIIAAPDWSRESFTGTRVFHSTRREGGLELTYVEYDHDPDPSDTTIESVCVYFLKEGKDLRVEWERHVTGLFPLNTWLNLMKEAGFDAEKRPYPSDEGHQPFLLVGVLR